MLILAIDTSQEVCSIGLGLGNEMLCEHHFHGKMSLLRRLLPNIEQMLDDSDRSVSDLDGIAVGLGPGSFTGLRVGITAAKSLAYVLSKPVVGVCTLDIMAKGAAPVGTDLICPLIHARANEVYWSLYDSTGDLRLENEQVSEIDYVLESVEKKNHSVYFLGSGVLKNEELIRHKFGNKAVIARYWSDYVRAAVLLEIGNKKLQIGEYEDPLKLVPIYLKKPTPMIRLESGEFERPR